MKKHILKSFYTLLALLLLVFLLGIYGYFFAPDVYLTRKEALRHVEYYKKSSYIPSDTKFRLVEVKQNAGDQLERTGIAWDFIFEIKDYSKRRLYVMIDRTAKVEKSLSDELGKYEDNLR